jgi:hypothetical protein
MHAEAVGCAPVIRFTAVGMRPPSARRERPDPAPQKAPLHGFLIFWVYDGVYDAARVPVRLCAKPAGMIK